MSPYRHVVRAAVVLLSSAIVAGSASTLAFAHARAHHKPHRGAAHKGALFVSPTGKSGAADRSCKSAAYSTVQAAVDAASAGSTVIVCRGTYTEDVIISTRLTLIGRDHAVIRGTSSAHGKCEQLGPKGPGSAPCLAAITIKSGNVTVRGFTVTRAIGEGILATGSLSGGSIRHVVIEGNRVVGNNLGGIPPTTSSPYPECVEVGQVPGDCGEGIHLMGVADARVSGNFISGNTGGVLLTDEFGPTHNNVVERNVITENAFDCGVTAPGHNPNALDSSGHRQPSKAGVYDNVIRQNRITNNGLKGEGAGVLFANATAGTASYNNLVLGNYIAGNELAGVTMHAHTLKPGQFEDLSGNRIVGNAIGKNNTGGDPLDGTAKDPATTGILVFSGTVPVNVTIVHNRIRDNQYGIWLGVAGHVTATLKSNLFRHVTTAVFTSP